MSSERLQLLLTSYMLTVYLSKCNLASILRTIYLFIYLFVVHVLCCVLFLCPSNSPLTMAVTWSLLVPMRFLTSQTKVVLTASSTFSTFSSLPVICTVSGSSPDILQRHKYICHEMEEKQEKKKRNENEIVASLASSTVRACRQSVHLQKCDVLCDVIKLSFLLPQKGNPFSHSAGKYDGDKRKIKIAGSRPNISSLLFQTLSFFSAMLIADNMWKNGDRDLYCISHYTRVKYKVTESIMRNYTAISIIRVQGRSDNNKSADYSSEHCRPGNEGQGWEKKRKRKERIKKARSFGKSQSERRHYRFQDVPVLTSSTGQRSGQGFQLLGRWASHLCDQRTNYCHNPL